MELPGRFNIVYNKVPKAYVVGRSLGWVLARMVDLMYQNNTAALVICR